MIAAGGVRRLLVGLGVALLPFGPAVAQPPAVPAPEAVAADDQSVVVEELEVLGRPPGPAMWRAVRGGSEVVILGEVRPLPHSLVWDTRRVERALEGAKFLLLSPQPHIGAVDAVALKLGLGGTVKSGTDLDASLPPDLRAHFDRARERALQKPKRYAGLKPAVAGFMLIGDYREAAGLSGAKPGSTLEKLARKKGVKVRTISDFRLGPLAKSAANLSDAENRACLGEALVQNDHEADHAIEVAKAWAVGDLRTVRAQYSTEVIERCLLRIPSAATLREQGVADTVRTLNDALSKPGKTVAVVDLGFLLRRNGVLDRLQAGGATISVPLE